MIENWDYARDLQLRTSLTFDLRAAARSLQIDVGELKLAIIVKIGSGLGRFPRRMDRVLRIDVDNRRPAPRELKVILPGQSLGGRLYVRTEVLLAERPSAHSPLSPNLPGARLWINIAEAALEDGGDTRFPMEIVSFSKAFKSWPHEHAPWYLSFRGTSFHGDFSGTVRLYVNADHAAFAQRVIDGDPHVLQAMLGDVMVQLANMALDQEDFSETVATCEDGSVGRQIIGWLATAFPSQALNAIRSIRNTRPGSFHAALHAAAEIGDPE
ncbi:hypothetical protein [Paracoccus hibiscisoli]|nr:hypothetical protein [Paracoccus hibiscisoli]